ncbi:sulfatase [Kiritimatiellota bacterium B12222]|nr:sulfatase [Kiritimatiellota bacterium B12222]
MNILYFHSHDTGRSIAPYGYSLETPRLQKLADEGALFLDAHCAAPTCSPSRAALLTGQSAHESGMVSLAHRGGALNFPERHLANFLKGHGFHTAKAGLSHVGLDDESHGYVEVLGEGHRGEEVVERASRFLKEYQKEEPFFLDAGFFETHRHSYGFNQEYHHPGDGDGDPNDIEAPPAHLGMQEDVKRDWKDYANAVTRLDGFYGQILDQLEASGLAEDTLVLVTTDHGVAFPEMKCSLTGRGTGVLLMMRLPHRIREGNKIKALVSHLDVFPTLCDLLKLEPPAWLEGRSLVPLLTGTSRDELHDEIFAEVTFHAAFEPKRSVRSKKWNYIRNFASPYPAILPNCDRGLTKDLWLREGRFAEEVAAEELYDLEQDPGEVHNVASDAVYAEIKAHCREVLAKWMKKTNDPLLSADASVLPDEIIVNTWDQRDPASGDAACLWHAESDWPKVQPL